MDEEAPVEECGTCGRPLSDADRHWSVELDGPEGYVGWTPFCSQDHAAVWIADPARAAEQTDSSDPPPMTSLLDRLVGVGLVLVLVLVVGLLALGSFQLAQLLGGWR